MCTFQGPKCMLYWCNSHQHRTAAAVSLRRIRLYWEQAEMHQGSRTTTLKGPKLEEKNTFTQPPSRNWKKNLLTFLNHVIEDGKKSIRSREKKTILFPKSRIWSSLWWWQCCWVNISKESRNYSQQRYRIGREKAVHESLEAAAHSSGFITSTKLSYVY